MFNVTAGSITANEMKSTIAQQQALFGTRLNKAKSKDTKVIELNNNNQKCKAYYNKNGKLLYAKTTVGKTGYTYYTVQDKYGNMSVYEDFDNDGKIDRYTFRDAQNIVSRDFTAFDEDDNGTFDLAAPDTGKYKGKMFNIKV